MDGMDWKSKRVRALLEAALVEDRATQDVTTQLTIPKGLRATGTIVANQSCIIAGLGSVQAFLEIFGKLVDPDKDQRRFEVVHHAEVFDGVRVKKGQTIAVIRHHADAILSTERVMLNLLQRMCGIATVTNEYVKAVSGTQCKIVDTRRTVPGLRALDKYAVLCGCGVSHRNDLRDGILIKANHIALGGGLTAALENVQKGKKPGQRPEVEVANQDELDEALKAGAEAIILEGMTVAAVKKSVKQIRDARPGIEIEAGGAMTLENVRAYAQTGVDFISVGALTQSTAAADLSMRVTANVF
jgi:nicotinate-nucleotide pyrophosphorylase (carboxylating)